MSDGRMFTTADVARITGLSNNTVIKCCNKGMFGYTPVPYSRTRRFTLKQVQAILDHYGIPAFSELTPTPRKKHQRRVKT